MRKLIYAINLTIDGCCDHDKLSGSDDVLEYHTHLLQDVGVLLYGRITYQLMVPFWPEMSKNNSGQTTAMNEFAYAFDAVGSIVVFSKSLQKTDGKNTRIFHTGLREEIVKLKQEPGKDILVGGVDLPSQLMELGLIDEYRLVVQPTVLGEGRRLAKGLHDRLQLKFVDTKILQSGCVALRYLKS